MSYLKFQSPTGIINRTFSFGGCGADIKYSYVGADMVTIIFLICKTPEVTPTNKRFFFIIFSIDLWKKPPLLFHCPRILKPSKRCVFFFVSFPLFYIYISFKSFEQIASNTPSFVLFFPAYNMLKHLTEI